MSWARRPQPLTRTQNAAGESSLGDIIADAQLWATSGPSWPAANGAPAVVAFMNSGGIRADINAGPITYGEAFSVQPFANVLVTMDMTGAQIDALLEQQFTGGNGVLQIPASLTYDRSQSRAGRQPHLEHQDRRRADQPRGDVPRHGQQLPRRRRRQLQHVHAGTNRFVGEIDLDAFARYVEIARHRAPRVRRTGSRSSRRRHKPFAARPRTRAPSPGSVIRPTEQYRWGARRRNEPPYLSIGLANFRAEDLPTSARRCVDRVRMDWGDRRHEPKTAPAARSPYRWVLSWPSLEPSRPTPRGPMATSLRPPWKRSRTCSPFAPG